MSTGLLAAITEPNIGRHLLREEGEVVVDEVRRHWVAYVRPALEAWLALVLLFVGAFGVDMDPAVGWCWSGSLWWCTPRGCSSGSAASAS